MKIPLMFIDKETTALYLAFCTSFRYLYIGFIDLFTCIVLVIIFIPLAILKLLTWIVMILFKKFKN